jgi:tRNA nucleotidyltransferase/poly(A) polymerase
MNLKGYKEFSIIKESVDTLKLSLPKAIYTINKAFKKEGEHLYVVGGAVRDAILGIKPKDFDLATSARPDKIQSILNDADIKNFPKGEAFGVISAIVDNEEFEIATFREDIGKGRRPEAVNFSTIDKDVLRRDLTINALFYDIDKEIVVDLVGGVKDLLDKIIRTVGNPLDRFGEDPLRKMRALRFASRLGAKLDPEVQAALSKDEFKDYKPEESLGIVSKERIRDEFLKSIEKAKVPSAYLQWLSDYGYWVFIFPAPSGYGHNDDSFINKNWTNSNNPIVQVATLLKNVNIKDNPKYAKQLRTQYAYTIEDIRQIELLHSLLSFDVMNIRNIKNDLDISGLKEKDAIEFAKNNAIDKDLVYALYDFKLSVKGNDPRTEGLSGKALGDKIKELEAEAFKKIYK